MGAFEDFVNQNLGIRRPIITDAGHPSQSLKAAGIVGTNYINSNNNQLYEKTGEDNINDWMPIGKLGHSRFSGESGIYLTVTGNSGFFENQNVIGTGAQINFIVTDEGFTVASDAATIALPGASQRRSAAEVTCSCMMSCFAPFISPVTDSMPALRPDSTTDIINFKLSSINSFNADS